MSEDLFQDPKAIFTKFEFHLFWDVLLKALISNGGDLNLTMIKFTYNILLNMFWGLRLLTTLIEVGAIGVA